jgi:hypothetical protein
MGQIEQLSADDELLPGAVAPAANKKFRLCIAHSLATAAHQRGSRLEPQEVVDGR